MTGKASNLCGLARSATRGLSGAMAAALVSPANAFAADAGGLVQPKDIFVAAAGGLLGWLGKLLADNINGRMTARREFINQTTGQITTLAKDHYWALANHAGLLAGLLEEYLNVVDFHLLLEWESAGDLASRLNAIAKGYSDQTFRSLCRLLWLFDKFQFEQSNTYLLTSDIAGRSCRQLYNSFIMSLPTSEENPASRLNTLAILDVMIRPIGVSGREDPVAGFELTEAEFNELAADIDKGGRPPVHEDPRLAKLREARGVYREWLTGQLDQVCVAAQSLRAYSELLGLELATLYRGWFRRVPNSNLANVELLAYQTWLDALTEDSVIAISRARSGSELLQALGRGAQPQRAAANMLGDAARQTPAPAADSALQGASP